MTAPAKKLDERLAALDDRTVFFTLYELEELVAECRTALKRAYPGEDAVALMTSLTCLYLRLGRTQEALEEVRKAIKYQPKAPVHRFNQAAVVAQRGEYQRAIELVSNSWEILEGAELRIRASARCVMAAALSHLGLATDARSALAEAIHMTPQTHAPLLMYVACTAAESGAPLEAIELFARSLAARQHLDMGRRSALEVIATTPRGYLECLNDINASYLRGLVIKLLTLSPEHARLQSVLAGLPVDDSDGDMDAHLEVAEATRPYRAAAMAALDKDDSIV